MIHSKSNELTPMTFILDPEPTNTPNFSVIPNEILNTIFLFLDMKSVAILGRVNRNWEELCFDNQLWKAVYFYHFMLPNYFTVVEREEMVTDDEEEEEEEEDDIEDTEDGNQKEKGTTNSEPPAKKRKLEKKFVVAELSKQEKEEKKQFFLSKYDEDEEEDWQRLSILRYRLTQLNSCNVMRDLQQMIQNPHQIETVTNNIKSTKSRKKLFTEQELETIRYEAVKTILEMKHQISHCRRKIIIGTSITSEFLKRNFYYYGVYYHNATNGASYDVAMETQFLIFNPETGIPALFTGSFTCFGYRGDEEYNLNLRYQPYTSLIQYSILHNRIGTNYNLRSKQTLLIGDITLNDRGDKVNGSTIRSALFQDQPVLKSTEAQAELERELRSALDSIALACDSSYEVYL